MSFGRATGGLAVGFLAGFLPAGGAALRRLAGAADARTGLRTLFVLELTRATGFFFAVGLETVRRCLGMSLSTEKAAPG